jgi:signal transduction histidine kinase/ligand-binding sensor domain-containing protein/CheY-like chemotaxis protein
MHTCQLLALMLTASYMHAAAPLPSQFLMDSWDITSDLPEETIYSATQTPDGYLWLANANGLVRYDGRYFQTYQPRQNLGGGAKQEISRMGPGPNNSVWVYSNYYGLVRFREGVFRRAPEYPKPCSVAQILKDGDATLIVCSERVLRIVGERVDELTKHLSRPVDRYRSAARDENGRLWIGLAEGGLAELGDHGNLIPSYGLKEGMPPGPVNYIFAAGANKLWVGTEHGLVLTGEGRLKLFTTREGLPSDDIRFLTLDRDKSLWVGTTKGVALRRDGHIDIISALPSSWVESIVEDREDNVWITLTDMKLYRLRKPKFLNWGSTEGLRNERPIAVVQSGDAIWIEQEGGLWRLTHGKLKPISLGPKRLQYMEKDDAGRIWALTDDQAFIIDSVTAPVRQVVFPADAGKMFAISRDRVGRMWIATGRGLFVADHGRVKPAPFAGLPPLVVRSDVRQSRDGRLWLSVNNVGLFELRDGKAVPVSLGADPELKRIYTFYIDSNNDFWFGFDGGGLARWRNGKLTRYGHQIGNLHNFVYYFAEDTEGYFWLGLRAGLVRVGKADLNAFLDGAAASEPKENFYDLADGLRSFNFGGANRTVAAMEPASVLWIPNIVGFIRIDSRNIPINRMVPPVHMEEVSADERVVPLGGTVSIPAGADTLRFRFSVPTLVAHIRVEIRYRLEPFDTTWRTTDLRSVSYSRVPPGKYTFTVRASNNDGVWNEPGATMGVVVLPKFYQTWWFRLLVAAVIVSGVAGIHGWRTTLLRQEKARLEHHVEQRTADLFEAMSVAENAARAKADFLATMSHEIRTPMHGVLGTLELLSETGLNAEQSDHLNTARNSSNSLLSLLNDILDLSKMEAGRMDLHVAPFSLWQTVVEVTRLLQAQANIQGITLSRSCGPGLPELFQGDEMRIRQIIFNLAGNAVKFTMEGQVAIEISGEQKSDLRWSLRVAVHDSGIGIPQERIPQLFQDFFQVNSAASRRFAGSGLGLTISKRLAAMMDGSISVESELGRGSTFCFLVDLPQSEPVAEAKNVPAEIATTRLFDAHILLAEDNVVNQKLAIQMLRRLGCRVSLAQNGREAVELAEQLRPPIIFMDCQMPEMDGFEATRLIRSGLDYKPVIIALTANSLPGDRERCIQAGMTDYLAKPFQRKAIAHLLNRYLPIVESSDIVVKSEIIPTK